jgi:CHAT domain-containing protein/tetratricopeptide (TPR) repeat protein
MHRGICRKVSPGLLTVGLLSLLTIGAGRAEASRPKGKAQDRAEPQPHERLVDRDRLHRKAITLQADGKLAEALAPCTQQLAIERAVLGECHGDVVATLRRLAELHAYLGDFENARNEAREALACQRKLPDLKRWQIREARRTLNRVEEWSKMPASKRLKLVEAARLSEQLLALQIKGNYREGIKLAQQIRELSEQALEEGDPDLATSLNNLGVCHHAIGEYDRAEPLYCKALESFKVVLGENHPDYVTTFNNLAVLYGLRGDYEKALPLYRKALELRKEAVGEKHPDYVRSVNNLAWVYKAMGDYANAEPLYLKALQLHEQGLDYGWPNSRILEIYRHVDLRRPPRAAEMQTDRALILGNLAVCYHEMGEYARAEPLYRNALEINKKLLGELSADYARNLNNLAALYQLMGDYTRAEPLFKKAVALRKEALGENHPDYATSLHNLARFYHVIEDYDRAEPFYLQALAIRKQKLGEKHPYYAQTLDKLAWLYHAKGDYLRAEPLYAKALEVRQLSLGEKHRYDATILTNQALLYHAMGEHDRAETLFRKSLEWTRKQVGEQNPEYARTLHHLAMLQFARKRYADGERLAREPVEISRNLLERCAGVQSERQQLAMMQTSRFYLDGYLSITTEAHATPGQVYEAILAGKGAVLARQRRLRLQRDHPELADAFAKLNRVAGRLAALALTVPDAKQLAAFRRQMETLTEEKERLESDLASRSAAFRQERAAARLAPAQLQAALPANAALIDFLEYTHRCPPVQGKGAWSAERRLVGVVVRPDSIEAVGLGPVQQVAELIDRWRSGSGVGKPSSPDAVDPGVELCRKVWEPLANHLDGVHLVLVSPDGPLNGLPLAALPGSRAGTFLIQQYAFATVPVPQLLAGLLHDTPGHPSEPASLVVGNIDFDAPTGSPTEAGRINHFPSLPGTRTETLAVHDLFRTAFSGRPADLLTGKEATKAAFIQQASKCSHLLVATHGFFLPEPEQKESPASGQLRSLETLRASSDLVIANPALRSGLVFAGANRAAVGHGDPFLTALEVSELDLRRVDLAVLSACETGLGKVKEGEGVLGLQRALQLAGAHTAVTTLWKVDDLATQALMTRFHRNLWEKRMGKLEALREAQLWLLEDGWKHPELKLRGGLIRPDVKPEVKLKEGDAVSPFFWAAFVLSGDWR